MSTVLKVERLDSEETQPTNFQSEFTPPRLQILLKYIRINPDFLRQPALFPRTLNLVRGDLAGNDLKLSSSELLKAIECWKERVAQSDQVTLVGRSPDSELKRLLAAIESRLTHTQITLILQHLEVVGTDSDTLWPTIAVEMRALKVPSRPEVYWRRSFEQWTQETRQRYTEDAESLSALQQRYIDFLRERNELPEDTPTDSAVGIDAFELVINHCRTCLKVLKVGSPKQYLFEARGGTMTLSDKINFCFGTEMSIDDRLPKYTCGECVGKVEVAYLLKIQIEQTDDELRNLMEEYESGANDESAIMEKVHLTEDTEEHIESLEVIEEQVVMHDVPDEQIQLFEVALTEEGVDIRNSDVQEKPEPKRVILKQESDTNNTEITEESSETYENTGHEEAVYTSTHEGFSISIYDVPAKTEEQPKLGRRKSRNKIIPSMPQDFFQCEQCRAVFRTFDLWQSHKSRHDLEKRYSCPVCSKQFRSASTLRVHRRTHTNERPYVCNICKKCFAQNTNLTYHMKVHQNVRDFPCKQCSYRARNQNDLNLHQRSHTGARPYVCDICECRFSTSSNLSKHFKRRHMGERNYKCEQCDKTFTTKETVQKHMVTHTRTKPYPCPVCNFTYSWYNGMQKHMKSVHPGIPIPTEKTMFDRYNEEQKVKIDEVLE
ncbi:zinc finger protein 180-like isoform X2 [Topomyia yanbarensis]|uniref:zinc finger protein 180-like isoform X2 n=1 Tax=Topomyia yanbarensis TaxID=2498891 RepID=UPI00273A890F|nr:zinc finger protein 180-like isoform X2 [Topomyia yanbarensis]